MRNEERVTRAVARWRWVMRDVREGWGVMIQCGLDFTGKGCWVFLREYPEWEVSERMGVQVFDTRAEARAALKHYRRRRSNWGPHAGGALKVREARVVKVRQVVEVVEGGG